MDDTWNFYKTLMKWAVNTPWVEKVFPFGMFWSIFSITAY
jgi:hypothetical protein